MFLSNEPGYYLPGHFGIRIENNLQVVGSTVNSHFLAFHNHTLVPYDTSLIERGLLTPEEVAYINGYHREVRRLVGQQLREKGHEHEYDYLVMIT